VGRQPDPGPVPPPAPPPPTAPARATLEIDVSGARDAVVLVDRKEWGRGETIKLELEAGSHEVEVRPPGRPAITKPVDLVAGQDKTIEIVVPQAAKPPPVRVVPTKRPPVKPRDDDDLLSPKGHK